jgi:hypothetical protein
MALGIEREDTIAAMTESDYRTEGMRCGNHLTEKGQEIARIGKDIAELATASVQDREDDRRRSYAFWSES